MDKIKVEVLSTLPSFHFIKIKSEKNMVLESSKIFVYATFTSHNKIISLHLKTQKGSFIFLDTHYYNKNAGNRKDWERKHPETPIVCWDFEFESAEFILDRLIDKHLDWKRVEIIFYHSLDNLYGLLDHNYFSQLFFEKHKNGPCIYKMGRYVGYFQHQNRNFLLNDLSNWNNIEGIMRLQTILGFSNPTENFMKMIEENFYDLENVLHQEKNFMPFLDNGLNMVNSLEFISQKMLVKINSLYENVYGFPKCFLLTEKNIPRSLGGIGSTLLKKFIYHFMSSVNGSFSLEDFKRFDLINLRLGRFSKEKTKKYNLKNRLHLKESSSQKSTVISSCSKRVLAESYFSNSGIYNSVTQGGRANNEASERWVNTLTADLDFKSCYGESLTAFSYPLGLPFVYAVSDEEEKITLKEFLALYEHEFVENLYTITISHRLNFEQDLLYSKIISPSEINQKDVHSEEQEGKLVLLRSELINSILTSDILNALRKVCTNLEWNNLMEATVITSCLYKKSEFLEPQEFLDYFDDHEKYPIPSYTVDYQVVLDPRSCKWTKIPLSQLVQPLLDQRNLLKKKKAESTTEEDKIKFAHEEQFYKLVINLFSGLLGSFHYDISNVLLYNNVTARARLNIWMASKPLLGLQSITDGFAYSVLRTVQFKDGAPKSGLDHLSKINNEVHLKDRNTKSKYIFQPLGNKSPQEWLDIYESKNLEALSQLNALAEKALDTFWNIYGLKLQYKIEHKLSHCGLRSLHLLKGHYAICSIFENQPMIFKFRGISIRSQSMYKKIAEILLYDLNQWITKDEFQKLLSHDHYSTQSIHQYLQQKRKGLSPILPGKILCTPQTFKCFAYEVPLYTKNDYLKILREEIDFAAPIIEKILKDEGDKVNLVDFFIQILLEKQKKYIKNPIQLTKKKSKGFFS